MMADANSKREEAYARAPELKKKNQNQVPKKNQQLRSRVVSKRRSLFRNPS